MVRKEKEKARAVDVSSYRQMGRTPWKCFRCGSEDHIIAKFPKQVCFNEIGHQAALRREETFTDQKSFNISSLQTDYLKIDSRSGFDRDSERAYDVQTECIFCGGVNHSAEQ